LFLGCNLNPCSKHSWASCAEREIPNQLSFFILSSLVNPADQTRPNSHQFSVKSIASKSILFFYLFVGKRARKHKKHQQIPYQIIRESFEKFFLADEKNWKHLNE
jgi:hypothetical protein